MTQKKAKEITLEVWTHLAEHPEIRLKANLPYALYEKIGSLYGECPLCEIFRRNKKEEVWCLRCPLSLAGENCLQGESAWGKWVETKKDDTEARKNAALTIVTVVKAWKPYGAMLGE